MIFHNYFYSILCTDSTRRAVTPDIYYSDRVREIRDILIPPSYSLDQRMILAELYIRFIKTDVYLNTKLLKLDPYNSYDIVEYKCTHTDNLENSSEVSVNLENIARAVRCASITNIRYTDTIGYILIGLEYLLDLCGELNGQYKSISK